MIAALAAGLVAGYGIAVPVGPVGAYLVTLGMRERLPVAAAAALGVASADGVLAAVAASGGTGVAGVLAPVARPLMLASALVVLLLALVTFGSAVRGYRAAQAPTAGSGGGLSPRRAYLRLLGLTVVNPATLAYFAALVLGERGGSGHLGGVDAAVFATAALAASASWQLLLACGASASGRVLTGRRGRLATAAVGSLVMAALAVRILTG